MIKKPILTITLYDRDFVNELRLLGDSFQYFNWDKMDLSDYKKFSELIKPTVLDFLLSAHFIKKQIRSLGLSRKDYVDCNGVLTSSYKDHIRKYFNQHLNIEVVDESTLATDNGEVLCVPMCDIDFSYNYFV